MTKQKYLPFKEAREYVRGLHFKNQKEFRKWHKSEKPPDIPSTPRRTYKKEWKGWGDWLGTGNIATFNKEILPFEEARRLYWNINLRIWNNIKNGLQLKNHQIYHLIQTEYIKIKDG
jgi:hypothetical protein